jgi:anti-sigma regulatory factor (Ser/Thr protein kinase)
VTAVPIAFVQLPPVLESVPAARSCTIAALRAWGMTSMVLDDVALLLTELTANAIRHAHGIVAVEVDLDGERLTVRVCDEEDSPPHVEHPTSDDEGGRGLWLVETIADRWGWETSGQQGKVVWFQVVTEVAPLLHCPPEPEAAIA